MAVTPEIRATQAAALVATSTPPTTEVRTTTNYALTAINYATQGVRSTQVSAVIAGQPQPTLRTSQVAVMVAVRVGAESKRLRAWTFSQDGHDLYVLHLGAVSTLVFDQSTQQWCQWASPDWNTWRAGMGLNWDNEVVGGDLFDGTIWDIDPTSGLDENIYPITSEVVGFIGWRGRDPLPCYGVALVGDIGNPVDASAAINLKISDDFGNTFWDCGSIYTPITGKYSYDMSWYSLGQIDRPGRLFKITDTGAMGRIDSLELLQTPAPIGAGGENGQ